MSLNFTQGDTAPDLHGYIHDEDDPTSVVDLNGATVRFQMRMADDHRYQVNAVASIVDAAAGHVMYQWGSNDLARPGSFVARWEVTYPGGRIQTTYPEVELTVWRQ